MTARPHLDERDPQPPQEWEPTSSEWARRQCREALEQKLLQIRESRKKPADQQDHDKKETQ